MPKYSVFTFVDKSIKEHSLLFSDIMAIDDSKAIC